MVLLILNLKDERLIQKVVGVMLELEISDATVLDSEGLENLAVQTNPLFSEIGSLFGQNLAYRRTLLAQLPGRETLQDLVRLCRRDGVDLTDSEVATIWVLPCESFEPEEGPRAGGGADS
ncbi:MAG: hypothetical protein U1E27_12400 [Kiritimatiellia bacterium]|nr:hypothetical protein [Kiritimatiellia bacterium]